MKWKCSTARLLDCRTAGQIKGKIPLPSNCDRQVSGNRIGTFVFTNYRTLVGRWAPRPLLRPNMQPAADRDRAVSKSSTMKLAGLFPVDEHGDIVI